MNESTIELVARGEGDVEKGRNKIMSELEKGWFPNNYRPLLKAKLKKNKQLL